MIISSISRTDVYVPVHIISRYHVYPYVLHMLMLGYVALVGEGRYADAIRLIRKDNPFPTTCGLSIEHPCEARCRRNMIDDSINIRGLKRVAADFAE